PYSQWRVEEPSFQRVVNNKADNNTKVLIIADSYRRPWEYFIASQFREIDTVRLGRYQDGTIAQALVQFEPDLVVMIVNSRGMYVRNRFDGIGIDQHEKSLENTKLAVSPLWSKDIRIASSRNQANKFEVLAENLKPGDTYTLRVQSVELEGSKDKFVQLVLQDLTSNKPLLNRYFEVESSKPQKWIFTVPKNPNSTFAVYLYAGIKGHTQNATAM
ncbi:MAG: hypothetical protein LUC43_03710, partial [Burkholderiales bacterium]|nr:hypothetical protein [Burkholderiales bacterium]